MELAFEKNAVDHLQKLVCQVVSQEETAETVVPDSLPEGDVFPFFHTQVENFRRQGARFADRARICRTAGEAAESWREGRTALFLTVENGAVLGRDLRRVEELARAGVVMVTLTWNGENELGSGSATGHGLSPLGRAAIPALEEAGIRLHTIPSAELSRGRGGPRCMSMPLWREDP